MFWKFRPAALALTAALILPQASAESPRKPEIQLSEEPADGSVETRKAGAGAEPIRGTLRLGMITPKRGIGSALGGWRGARVSDLEPVPGSAFTGGDLLLQNDRISVVITAPGHASGNALSGGYIIDAFLNEQPIDSLGQLHLYLDNTYPRMARFSSALPVKDASTTDSVKLVVEGVDSQDPTIKVWQTYALRNGSNVVEIETGVTPTRERLVDFRIGDAFAWGSTQQFLPGVGFETSGRFFKAPWVGGLGNGVAYGYFAEGGDEMTGPLGSTWIDTNVTTGTAEVGKTITSRRRFTVGHDLAEISRAWLDEAGTSYSQVQGTITEAESGRPADGVRVNITAPDGTSVTQAITREGGKFTAWLPAGTYVFTTSDVVRSSVGAPATLNLPQEADKPLQFQVASPAVVAFRITDETGEPVPSKVRFFGLGDTPDPDLGPAHQVRTRNVIYLADGEERITLPAGDYNIVATRGIEYNMTSVTVSLKRNRATRLALPLKRAYDPNGMIGGDFHLHMKNSFDSAIALEDRVISCAGEGLQFIVATDHNYVTDLRPVIERLGLKKWIQAAVGNEVTTRDHFFGHFNVFPREVRPDQPGNGATPYEKVTAQQLMASALFDQTKPIDFRTLDPKAVSEKLGANGKVLQINHARSGDIGYFDRVQLSPDDATTTHPNWSDRFTALEIFNGKRIDQFEEVWRDWANLLNMGYTYTATGNSDSHKIYDQEAGYPRNYIAVGKRGLNAAGVVEAINAKHAVLVTNGPFITFTSRRGAPIGAMETKKSGKAEFDVKIEGADFVQPDSVSFYGNGKLLKKVEIAETAEPLKWQGSFEDEPTTDTWYTVVVRGKKSMFPVLNPLVEGTANIEPVPLAFTNPIWVDRNGDGRFTGINQKLFPLMHEDRSAEALSRLDELTTQSKQRKLPRKKSIGGES